MRREPFFVNDFVHVYNRGNRKQEIVRDEHDCEYFLQALYYFNTTTLPANPFQELKKIGERDTLFNLKSYMWPTAWQQREPIVKIVAFILLKNHFHLLLQEIKEGGVSLFMKKFGIGMTNRFNTRYEETGKLFQGSYKARRVDSDNYLRYLFAYIQIKNAFEMYPGGAGLAVKNFDKGYDFAARYPYGSLTLNGNDGTSSIIDNEYFRDIFGDIGEYKAFAKNCLPFMGFNEKKCTLTF